MYLYSKGVHPLPIVCFWGFSLKLHQLLWDSLINLFGQEVYWVVWEKTITMDTHIFRACPVLSCCTLWRLTLVEFTVTKANSVRSCYLTWPLPSSPAWSAATHFFFLALSSPHYERISMDFSSTYLLSTKEKLQYYLILQWVFCLH